MFWSSPSADIQIIIFLLILSLGIAMATYFFSRKILLSIFVMSLLSNIVLYLNSGSRAFGVYDLKSIVIFTLDYWPYINLILFFVITVQFFRKTYTLKKS